ncbi:MAG: nucleoside-diphosphate sugar epimerase [Cytophagales bacterium]|nr:MAG: nucleoside-diphosphate sugar epimerase [Cytophagales bacterium]
MTTKNISVLGCGWLGLALASKLVELGHQVKGSTTSHSKIDILKKYSIKPYIISFPFDSNPSHLVDFFRSDFLIINIPPKSKTQIGKIYLEAIEQIVKEIEQSDIKKLIYISSTSVYKDLDRVVVEEDCTSIQQSGNELLFQAEELIRNIDKQEIIILRCAGLVGYERMLVKFFAGKKNIEGGNSPVNLIHRDDVISIIIKLLEHPLENMTLNICSPIHPSRAEFYTHEALKYGFQEPNFNTEDHMSYKEIGVEKLLNTIGYSFIFPDPLNFAYGKDDFKI